MLPLSVYGSIVLRVDFHVCMWLRVDEKCKDIYIFFFIKMCAFFSQYYLVEFSGRPPLELGVVLSSLLNTFSVYIIDQPTNNEQ